MQSITSFVETSFKLVNVFSKCFVFARVVANHRHIILYVREIAENFLIVTDVYVFTLLNL